MKKTIMIITLALSASALADNKPYFAASFDNNQLDTGVSSVTGTSTLDEKDTGYSILAGFQTTDRVSIEVSYRDLGEASLSSGAGDSFVLDGVTYTWNTPSSINMSGSAIGVGGLVKITDGGKIQPFVKGGFYRWDLEGGAVVGSTTVTLNDDGTDAYLGFGALIPVTETVSVRAEYTSFEDVKGFGIGIQSRF